MEPQIRHVRFFNGQFLRQDEFNEEQLYANHMRRRVNYALFEDGVVEVTAGDLTVVREAPANPADKRVHVQRGMAVGANQTLFESREIILREDTAPTNLATNFAAGDTVWVTVNYRRVESAPVAMGSSTENSRVEETAEIRFSKVNPAGTVTADGDPLIVLGSVDFTSMAVSAAGRQVARLRSSLFAATPTISVSPNQVTAGTVGVTLALSSSGGLNLSALAAGDITAMAGISNVAVSNQAANSATVTFDVAPGAAPGARTFTVTVGAVSAQTTLTVQAGLAVTGFTGVNEPLGNTTFAIDGTGFSAPATVEFTASGGGFTAPVTVAAGNISSTQLRIPMASIPANATRGPVRVVSGGQTVVSGTTVTPPPVITTAPALAASQSHITITGARFFPGTSVTLPGNFVRGPASAPPFPAVQAAPPFSESRAETTLVVKLVSNAGDTGRVLVTTDGGTVQSALSLSVS